MSLINPEFMDPNCELAKKVAAALERMAEAGRNMTPEDHRAQAKSYALADVKTEEDREWLSAWYDRRYGVTHDHS